MTNQTLDLSKFKILKHIGQGNFSDVYRVENLDTKEDYAAKVMKNEFIDNEKNSQEKLFLFREINIMASLNHPSIIHYFGFFQNGFQSLPNPTILIEYVPNGTLKKLITDSDLGLSHDLWDETKKLICIYGIASGMSFLHKHKIIHRDLKPENILMDENLFPKISDFGLSKINSTISESLCAKSEIGFKGTILYAAPEVFTELNYSEKSDVYSFAIIAYQIVTGVDNPFPPMMPFNLMQKIANGERPELTKEIPKPYRSLIKNCWDPDPNNRPTFDQILEVIKNDSDFITDAIDDKEFFFYQEYLDESQVSFDIEKNRIRFDYFLRKNQAKIHEEEKKKSENKPSDDIKSKLQQNEDKTKFKSEPNNDAGCKLQQNEDKAEFKNYHSIYPLHEFDKLSESNQTLVRESSSNPSKQFIVGKNLIEGLNDFPHNVQLGIKYLQLARIQKYNESIIYLSKMYVTGEVVPQDLDEAREILNEFEDKNDVSRIFLLGLIELNEGNNQDAFHLFQNASKFGSAEAMFYCGKMLMDGEGIEKNEKEGQKYLDLAKKNGYQETYKPKEISKNKKIKQKKKEKKIKDEKKELKIPKDVKIKIFPIGDGAVSKTYTLYVLSGKSTENFNYYDTYGTYIIPEEYNGSKITLCFRDFPGQEGLENIRAFIYPKTDIFLLFFSVVEPVSLYNISGRFIPEIAQYTKNDPTIHSTILVGCKTDLCNDEATLQCLSQCNQSPVSKEEANEFALKNGIKRTVFISNKTGEGLKELKNAIIETYLEQIQENKSCTIF